MAVSCASGCMGPPGAQTIRRPSLPLSERRHLAGPGAVLEQTGGIGPGEIEARALERPEHLSAGRRIAERRLQPHWIAPAARPDHPGVRSAVRGEEHQLDRLQAFGIEDADFIAGVDRHGARAAARHRVALDTGRQHRQARHDHAGALIRRLEPKAGAGRHGHPPVMPGPEPPFDPRPSA